MTRIVKSTGFFKKNYSYLYGGFLFIAGLVAVILGEGGVFYLYIPIGFVSLLYGYTNRNKTEEYISWDNSAIIVKDLADDEKVFPIEKIDSIFISNQHLTIKYGAAGGIILDLKGYSDVDLNQLNAAIERGFQQPVAINKTT